LPAEEQETALTWAPLPTLSDPATSFAVQVPDASVMTRACAALEASEYVLTAGPVWA
jgi:hypothetical protein